MSVFSPYQAKLKGLIPRLYYDIHVVLAVTRRKELQSSKNLDCDRLEAIKDKHIKQLDDNIEFMVRQINQQTIESI